MREELPMQGIRLDAASDETSRRVLVSSRGRRAQERGVEPPSQSTASLLDIALQLDRIDHQLNTLAVPAAADFVFFMAGVPVAPWMRARPLNVTWKSWLARLCQIVEVQLPANAVSRDGHPPIEAMDAWEQWSALHAHAYRFRRVSTGLAWLLARLAACRGSESAGAHVIGHSAGGTAALAYLAGLRAGIFPMPGLALRSVITLDAAVHGLAGRWTNLHGFLRRAARTDLRGLGTWAREHGIALLTIANEHDLWSHPALDDIPYLRVPIGMPGALRAHLDGSIHAELRNSAQIIEALWRG
jgi:hypothetical protein